MTLSSPSSSTLLTMNSFTLVHRPKERPGALPVQSCVWSTCLREIAFLEDHVSQEALTSVKEGNLEVYRDEDALLFLLQVLCGLKSPVLGETEVLGQFKAYTHSLSEDHLLRSDPALLPFLLATVKEARTKFLSATGSLTYGQIVRRWVKDHPAVTLYGYGSLGSEIYPWIREKTSCVVVRSPRVGESAIPFSTIGAPASACVIAAPLEDSVVEGLSIRSFVVDLRDRALRSSDRLKNLGDLFREIREMRRHREESVPRCEEFLRAKSAEFGARHRIRPFGWEDLCS